MLFLNFNSLGNDGASSWSDTGPPSARRETFPSAIQSARSLERQSIIADWFGLTVATTEFHNNLAGERERVGSSALPILYFNENVDCRLFYPSSSWAADNFLPWSLSRTVLFKFLPGADERASELGPFRFSFRSHRLRAPRSIPHARQLQTARSE